MQTPTMPAPTMTISVFFFTDAADMAYCECLLGKECLKKKGKNYILLKNNENKN